jgi:S1-C subfamily serine protease
MDWRRRQGLQALLAGLALPALALPPAARADLVELVARSTPSIVIVGTFNPTDSPRFRLAGTGFVAAAGNLVVTNAHVLSEQARARPGEPGTRQVVQVWRARQQWELREVTVLVVDRLRDLALLRVDGAPLPPMRLAAPGRAREGQAIAFIGFPIGGVLGFAPVTHRGIVSSITTVALPVLQAGQLHERALRQLTEGNFEILQLDAIAYPGNSGGPVFDATSGEVVGVINMVMVKGTREAALSHPTGLSYAVPVRYVHELLAARR